MSLELDWLEREERYRQRVTRLMTVAAILVAVVLGTGFYVRSRHVKQAREAAARRTEEQQREAARRVREQFTADSSATAGRLNSFKDKYHPEPLEGLPLMAIPLPSGQPIQSFVERAWADYVQAIDPNAAAAETVTWFRQNYVDIMNTGPLRGRAILLPMLEQKGLVLEIQKSTFAQITRAQVEVGMREATEAKADSTAMSALPPAANATGDTPASEPTTGASGDTSGAPAGPPKPPPSAGTASTPSPVPPPPAAGAATPVEPVPAQTAPPETLPSTPAASDTLPKP